MLSFRTIIALQCCYVLMNSSRGLSTMVLSAAIGQPKKCVLEILGALTRGGWLNYRAGKYSASESFDVPSHKLYDLVMVIDREVRMGPYAAMSPWTPEVVKRIPGVVKMNDMLGKHISDMLNEIKLSEMIGFAPQAKFHAAVV